MLFQINMNIEKSKESKSFNEKEEYSCNVCAKSYLTKDSLRKHMLSHSDRKLACTICYASFGTASYLKSYLKTHTGEKSYSCKLCDARFVHKGNLGYHMITHTKEKVLTKHMKSHTGEKIHSCVQCKAMFKTKWELQSHLNFVHLNYKGKKTQESFKPFSCEDCSKSFLHKSYLKQHLVVHTDLSCKICKKNFDSKLELTLHLKSYIIVKFYFIAEFVVNVFISNLHCRYT